MATSSSQWFSDDKKITQTLANTSTDITVPAIVDPEDCCGKERSSSTLLKTVQQQDSGIIRRTTLSMDSINEMQIRMASNTNWEAFLLPAPLNISVLGHLMLLATGNGMTMSSQKWKRHFENRHSKKKSFLECLLQVSKSAFDTFLCAESNMTKIGNEMDLILHFIDGTREDLSQPTAHGVHQFIIYPDVLFNALKRCRESALEVEKAFETTIQIVEEVICAAADEQMVHEIMNKKSNRERNRLLLENENEQKILKEIDEHKSLIDDETEKALNSYLTALDDIPSNRKLVTKMMVDTTSASLIVTSGVLAVGGIIVLAANSFTAGAVSLVGGLASAVGGIMMRKHNRSDKAELLRDVIAAVSTSEWVIKRLNSNVLINETEEYQLKLQLTKATKLFEKSSSKTHNSYMRAICDAGIALNNETHLTVQMKTPREPIEAALNRVKKMLADYEQATKEANSIEIIDEYRLKVNHMRAEYQEYQKAKDESFEAERKALERRFKIIADLKALDSTSVDVKALLEYLNRTKTGLVNLQEQWTKLGLFFERLPASMKSCQQYSLNNSNEQEHCEMRDILLTCVMTTGYAIAIRQLTNCYRQLSAEHVMPQLAELNRLSVIPSNDHERLRSERERLCLQSDSATTAIHGLLSAQEENFKQCVIPRLNQLASEFDKFLLQQAKNGNLPEAILNGMKAE